MIELFLAAALATSKPVEPPKKPIVENPRLEFIKPKDEIDYKLLIKRQSK